MMHRHMDSLIRDGDAGRVIGVAASYSPRFNPETGERLEGFWSNGNIDTDKPVVRVRARKGVIIGTGGYWGNVEFRTMFNPRTREPSFQYMTAIMGEKHMMPAGLLPV